MNISGGRNGLSTGEIYTGSYSYTASIPGGYSDSELLFQGDINSDGLLNYTLTATHGDFKLKCANLIVEARENYTQVSDGGAMLAMLGIVLVGLARFRGMAG